MNKNKIALIAAAAYAVLSILIVGVFYRGGGTAKAIEDPSDGSRATAAQSAAIAGTEIYVSARTDYVPHSSAADYDLELE